MILIVVSITSSDHDLELVTCLTCVDRVTDQDWSPPEAAFDLSCALGILARLSVRVQTWIAFEVDIEALTAFDGRTFAGAKLRVVRLECSVTKVAVGRAGLVQVGEGIRITRRKGSLARDACKGWIGQEC